jgi:hypothetical protein
MRSQHLTEMAELDVAAVAVVDDYLDRLADRLRTHAPLTPEIAAELRDDLVDATMALIPDSPTTIVAAHRALDDFGDVESVAQAMQPELAARRARRTGIALLVSGPLIGACWLTAVFTTAHHTSTWLWLPVLIFPVLMVGAPATALTVASTGRLCRWLHPRTALTRRALTLASAAAGVGDLFLLAGSAVLLLLPGPLPSPLLALAAAASLARLGFVGRTLGIAWLRRLLGPPYAA